MSLVGQSYEQDLGKGEKIVTTVTEKGIKAELYQNEKKVSSFELSKEGITVEVYNDKGEYGGKVVTTKGAERVYDKDGKEVKVKMTDPDAGGGDAGVGVGVATGPPKVFSGVIEHGINPDLGLDGGGPMTPEDMMKRAIDLLYDPIDDGESSVGTSTAEKAKPYVDIHGPRTLNPNSGIEPPMTQGGVKGGGDPSNQS